MDHVVPALSADSANALATVADSANDDTLVSLAVDGVDVPLDSAVRDALVRLLSLLGEGQSVTLGTVSELLTTSQAAEILGVSDTYVRRLADAGTLPTEMRGTHRRFRLSDVTAYR
ncbi:helix-turn-helix domain-containing protein [Rhodococcus sp. NPDC058521]|uniref:helix-turn-helix domain-containing protein n=1 Tax=Rhodococcus sp. NPDC058521 TaxID=3346536 RepID=UPI003654E69F